MRAVSDSVPENNGDRLQEPSYLSLNDAGGLVKLLEESRKQSAVELRSVAVGESQPNLQEK